jgi:molybdopterin converting factor small subunit
VARLRLLGPARDAAGRASDDVPGTDVTEVLRQARRRYGERFGAILDVSQVWLNGESVDLKTPVGPEDEIAVLPPVSGG